MLKIWNHRIQPEKNGKNRKLGIDRKSVVKMATLPFAPRVPWKKCKWQETETVSPTLSRDIYTFPSHYSEH